MHQSYPTVENWTYNKNLILVKKTSIKMTKDLLVIPLTLDYWDSRRLITSTGEYLWGVRKAIDWTDAPIIVLIVQPEPEGALSLHIFLDECFNDSAELFEGALVWEMQASHDFVDYLRLVSYF